MQAVPVQCKSLSTLVVFGSESWRFSALFLLTVRFALTHTLVRAGDIRCEPASGRGIVLVH